MGPLTALFWTSDDFCLGFQSQGGCLHSSLPVCKRILRFTSGVTPADLLAGNIASRWFSIPVLVTQDTPIFNTNTGDDIRSWVDNLEIISDIGGLTISQCEF